LLHANKMSELTYPGGKLRLYVDAPLSSGARVAPDAAQTHYLLHVMRAKGGDRISLFNGRDGEWSAALTEVGKRAVTLMCEAQVAAQDETPDLWFVFAPVKKTPADYVVQKATELGVRVLQPVFTRRTIVRRINEERMRANAVEAAEQSGRRTVPETRAPLDLQSLLAGWPGERRILFCDEGGDALPVSQALLNTAPGSWAVLTGPEGGFDPAERDLIRAKPFVTAVTLGKRILRADTAGLAALAIWQALAGDWR
jgi:16S rRNA (uracil1498-N3)-methyltransferase